MNNNSHAIFNQNLIKSIEKEFLKIIIDNLRNGTLKLSEAKENAKSFLDLLPFASFEDIKKKIGNFVLKYPLYQKIYLSVLNIEEEVKTQSLLNRMRSLLKENKIDEALKVTAEKNE